MNGNPVAGKQLAYVGGGNMAEALIRGVLAGRICEADQLTVTDILPERLAYLRDQYEVSTEPDNAAAVAGADVVLLAVKPQQLGGVLAAIQPHLPADALVISIVAGVRARSIEERLSPRQRVVRVMPNTPSLVGCGAAAVAAGTHATSGDLDLAAHLLAAVGIVTRVEEDLLDAVTAVSGSGPAYVFYVMEAMIASGLEMGLDPETARNLVVQTVEGSARLVRETGEEPASLRQKVTSKGGTTEAALKVLVERDVGTQLGGAMRAACDRSRDLSSLST